MSFESVLAFPAVLLSVVVHEWGHARAATWLGDATPRERGRLTLNPWPHLDPIGSVVVPAVVLALGTPFHLAWGRPVPTEPAHMRDPRTDPAKVALAGPLANVALALGFVLAMRLAPATGFGAPLRTMAYAGVTWNLALAGLNLIPIPPLDGARIVAPFVRLRHLVALHQLRPVLLVLAALVLFSPWTSPLVYRAPLDRAVRGLLALFGVTPPAAH